MQKSDTHETRREGPGTTTSADGSGAAAPHSIETPHKRVEPPHKRVEPPPSRRPNDAANQKRIRFGEKIDEKTRMPTSDETGRIAKRTTNTQPGIRKRIVQVQGKQRSHVVHETNTVEKEHKDTNAMETAIETEYCTRTHTHHNTAFDTA